MKNFIFTKIQPKRCKVEGTNHYNGFGPIKNKNYDIFIVGAPRLKDAPKKPLISDNVDSSKTHTILSYLIHADPCQWGENLLGHFTIIFSDKKHFACHIITDIGNSFSLFTFKSQDSQALYFSNDIDRIAVEAGIKDDIDEASLVDYLTNQSIAYPYTFYKNIRETPYASVVSCRYDDKLTAKSIHYWQPTISQSESMANLGEAGKALKSAFVSSANAICQDKSNIGLFLSGGIDSRVIAGALYELGYPVTALTSGDIINDELLTAKKVADTFSYKHEYLIRPLDYYPKLIRDGIGLEGPHFCFTRYTHLGFKDQIEKRDFDAICGGYMSDTLLKLHEANVVPKTFLGRDLGTLEHFDKTPVSHLRSGSEYLKKFMFLFRKDLVDTVIERRTKLLSYWEGLRKDGSAWEWTHIWPYMRNRHHSNMTNHINHYQAFELFSERPVAEIASKIPQTLKINGRLFNTAFRSYLKYTSHIPITVTMMPIFQPYQLDEFMISLKHFLPRRMVFRNTQLNPDHPFATYRSTSDIGKLWHYSAELQKAWRSFEKDNPLDGIFYQLPDPLQFKERHISSNIMFHIKSSLLTMKAWREYVANQDKLMCHS